MAGSLLPYFLFALVMVGFVAADKLRHRRRVREPSRERTNNSASDCGPSAGFWSGDAGSWWSGGSDSGCSFGGDSGGSCGGDGGGGGGGGGE